MAARANVVINDAATTPVAHTFVPSSVVDDRGFQLATWTDRANSSLLAQPVLTLSKRPPNKGSTSTKVVAKLVFPTMETLSNNTASGINPAPTLAYNHVCVMEITLPQRGTVQERKDLIELFRNFMVNGAFQKAVQDYEMPW